MKVSVEQIQEIKKYPNSMKDKKTGDYILLEQVFEKCQQFSNDKNEILINTLKCLD